MNELEILPSIEHAKGEVIQLHGELFENAVKEVAKVIRAGELLAGIKAGLKHGEWLPWIEKNLPFDRVTAFRYMRVYERRTELKCFTVKHITDVYRLLGGSNTAHVSHNAGENEWYTPPEYIEAAKEVMGGIDCDPASSKAANRVVGAKVYFTKEDDGLQQKWSGNRVWLNPPYAQPLVAQFADTFVAKHRGGEFREGCVLVNNATETDWFQKLLVVAAAICFPAGRVRFLDVAGKPGAPLQGQAIIYVGRSVEKFIAVFKKFGPVLCRS
jgi:ParB family chromosome partitioning protein